MDTYNYGRHADLAKLGELALAGSLDNITGADKWAHEFHFVTGSTVDSSYLAGNLSRNRTYILGSSQRFTLMGFSSEVDFVLEDNAFPSLDFGSKYRIRVEVDNTGTSRVVTLIFNNGVDPEVVVDASAFDGSMSKSPNGFNMEGKGDHLLNRFIIQKDTGAGWEDAHVFDPNQVRNETGQLVPRGDASAEAGADGKIYDLLSTATFDAAAADSTAFPAVYDIVSVNGGTIAVGDTGNTVTMSNAITVDDVYFTDGTNSYHPTFTVTGETITFDVPLTSDDTMPNFGTLTMNVVSGPDTFSKTFEFTAPAGHTVRLLQDPIELDESAYSHGMGFTPVAGDNYFWLTNTDFDIDANNVITPTGDAPWQYTVWHLSGAGLRETSVQSGYGSANVKPTANAGPDQINVAAGATVTLDGSASSDTDGTITGYSWTQPAGDTVTLSDATAVSPTFTAPVSGASQTLTFQLTVTDDAGDTGTDTVNVGVLAQVIPTTTITTQPQTVTIGEQFTIQADTTDAASFSWACTSGQSPTIVDASVEDLVVTLNEAGAHTFEQTVTSSTGDTATASVVLTAALPADVTRPVINVDTTPITVEHGSVFTPPTATAADARDGDLTSQIVVSNPVNTGVVGIYTVTYSGPIDKAGNVALPVSLQVTVVDTQAPTLSLNGPNPLNVTVGESFTDPGATLTDSYDGVRTVYSDDVVDTSSPQTVVIKYTGQDSSGNPAQAITRTVNIAYNEAYAAPVAAIDVEPPVIMAGKSFTLDGSASLEAREYKWEQVTGPNIVLTSPSESKTTQIAPKIASTQQAMFKLTVKNSKGEDRTTITKRIIVRMPPKATVKVN